MTAATISLPRLRRFFWPPMGAWAWGAFPMPDAKSPVIMGLGFRPVAAATARKFPRAEGRQA
jgi:hypothetical protein